MNILRNLVFAAAAAGAADAFAGSLTRTSAFAYDPATGLLVKEIVEPDDPNLCVVTEYQYDSFGNRTSATVRNCNGSEGEAAAPAGNAVFTSRTSTTTYTGGRFPASSTNALTHTETRTFDARFGTLLSLTGPNGLTTSWTYDGFGRKQSETRADGTVTTWTYTLCSTACPPGAKYSLSVAATGAPGSTSYYDALNRTTRTETQGFDGTPVRRDTQFDSLGRVAQVSQPYYANATPAWVAFTYDALGRQLTETQPNGAVATTTYDGLVTSVTNALNQTETRTRNSQGQLIQVTRQ